MDVSTHPEPPRPAARPGGSSRFGRLGAWCCDRRKLVLGMWLAALVVVGVVSSAAGSGFRDEFTLPDVESKTGFDILDDRFGGQGTGQVGTIVYRAEQGVDDPAVRRAMQALFERVATIEDVVRVVSPYTEEGERQISSQGPNAGKIAYASVEMPEDMDIQRGSEIGKEILAAAPDIGGLRIELGGFIFAGFEPPSSEIIGLAFAVVILILAFGSVLAMGLPVGVALFGIGIGTMTITLLSKFLAIPDFTTFLGIMIGLGVGIDYALLIVTRYREQLHAGHTVRDSVAIALDTAGRSVLFAGTTVVISLLGLLLMGVSFVDGLAVGAASVVAVTVAASLTLLPGLLGFAGERIERTRWRGLVAAALVAIALVGIGVKLAPLALVLALGAVAVLIGGFFVGPLKREVRHRPAKPLPQTLAYRWSRAIQHRPWTAALAGALALLVLAVPVVGLRLGFSDESNYEEDTTTRQAYDLLVAGFGPGFNGPLLLVTELPEGTDASDLEAVNRAVSADPGVAFVSPARLDDPADPDAAMWTVVPTTGPQDERTTDLVYRLRGDVLPPVERAAGIEVAATGTVAVNVDFAEYLSERMPYFFGAVLALSFLLLLVVFRSLLVPVKAVIMNLLSISAAYGVVVALFQWGWLSDVTAVQPAPIEPWAPMMLFAIVFGLSMDYEVFLLSRVREEWRHSGDSRTSVADGLAATAKVITAAAAIMVFVFGSFILENDRILKLMGTGLATAIFLDATIVRLLLVPATMELLGDRNWWLPRPLARLVPEVAVEGRAHAAVDGAERERQPAGVDAR
ncbi:MAG: MMPL family transporter [Actinomycetota bacterium]|nr:MMPL family transporter [Actinomycetota bacterium]